MQNIWCSIALQTLVRRKRCPYLRDRVHVICEVAMKFVFTVVAAASGVAGHYQNIDLS